MSFENKQQQLKPLHSSSLETNTTTPLFNHSLSFKNRINNAAGHTPETVFDDTKHTEQLKHIQEQSIRRRQERSQQIHDLDLELARITAKLAHVTMERQEEYKTLLKEAVHQPLEQMIERLSLLDVTTTTDGGRDGDESNNNNITKTIHRPQSHWMQLESRLSNLQAQMIHGQHVVLTEQHKRLLGTIQKDIQETIIPLVQEQAKNETKSGRTLESTMEQLTGTLKRQLIEEQVARETAFDMCVQSIQSRHEMNEQRGREYLEQIGALRVQLAREQEERKQCDAIIREKLRSVSVEFQQTVLGSLGDDEDDDEWSNDKNTVF